MKFCSVFFVACLYFLCLSFHAFSDCPKEFCEECDTTKVMKLNYLKEVNFNFPGLVVLSQGSKNQYYLKGSKEDLSFLKVHLHPGGDLVFEPKGMSLGQKTKGPVVLYLTVKDLNKLVIGDKARVEIKNFTSNALLVDLKHSCSLKGNLKVKELEVVINGDSRVELKGSGVIQEITIKGNAQYLAKDFKSEEVSIDAEGSSSIEVYASRKLSVRLEGSGEVFYQGNPKEVNQHITGKGSIRKLKI